MAWSRTVPSARLGWALLATTAWAGGGAATALAQPLEPAGALVLEPVTVTATTNPMESFEFPPGLGGAAVKVGVTLLS